MHPQWIKMLSKIIQIYVQIYSFFGVNIYFTQTIYSKFDHKLK
jgi:hypothetical protein